MSNTYLKFTLQSLVLIFIHVVLINNIRVYSYLIPILYSYPLIKLPIHTPRITLIALAFVVGAIVDALMNTPGLNMAAFTLVGYIRTPMLRLSLPEETFIEADKELVPSLSCMRPRSFFLFMFVLVLIHISTIFLLEAFSVHLFTKLLPYIVGSTTITTLVFLLFETVNKRRRHKLR